MSTRPTTRHRLLGVLVAATGAVAVAGVSLLAMAALLAGTHGQATVQQQSGANVIHVTTTKDPLALVAGDVLARVRGASASLMANSLGASLQANSASGLPSLGASLQAATATGASTGLLGSFSSGLGSIGNTISGVTGMVTSTLGGVLSTTNTIVSGINSVTSLVKGVKDSVNGIKCAFGSDKACNKIDGGANARPTRDNVGGTVLPSIGKGQGIYIPKTDQYYVKPVARLEDAIIQLTNYVLFFLGFAAGAIILYNGIQIVIGGSDASGGAFENIKYAIIGIVVVVFSYSIVNFVLRGLGEQDAAGGGQNVDTTTGAYPGSNGDNTGGTEVNENPIQLPVKIEGTSNERMVKAVIRATAETGQVPFTVILDASESTDPSNQTILDDNYDWTYIDGSGNEQDLEDIVAESKSFQRLELTTPGSYVIRLRVKSTTTGIADGEAFIRLVAKPKIIDLKLDVNDQRVEEASFVKILFDDTREGVRYGFENTTSLAGDIRRTSISYGDGKRETYNGLPIRVVHAFPGSGLYRHVIQVEDVAGNTRVKYLDVMLGEVIARLRVNNSIGNTGTIFTFFSDGSRVSATATRRGTKYEALKIADDKGRTIEAPVDVWQGKFDNQDRFGTTFAEPGIYRIRMTLLGTSGSKDPTDKDGAVLAVNDTDTLDIKVLAAAPKAGLKVTFPDPYRPAVALLDASSSYDPDSAVLYYSWAVDGEDLPNAQRRTEPTLEYTFATPGRHTVAVVLTDDQGNVTRKEVEVNVNSTVDMVVRAEPAAAVMDEATKSAVVRFAAEASSEVERVQWEWGDGSRNSQNREEATNDVFVTTHTYTAPGTYRVVATATDVFGKTLKMPVKIVVSQVNTPAALAEVMYDNAASPRLVSGLCTAAGTPQDAYQFTRTDRLVWTAENSAAAGAGATLAYTWEFSDGSKSRTERVTKSFSTLSKDGVCDSARLKVRDSVTQRTSEEYVIYYMVTNQSPGLRDLSLSGTVDGSVSPVSVQLKAVGSFDKDGNVVSYRWYYYDPAEPGRYLGQHTTKEPETTLLIDTLGSEGQDRDYNVVVEVTDNEGRVTKSEEALGRSETVRIKNGKPLQPKLTLQAAKTALTTGERAFFTANLADPNTGATIPGQRFEWDMDGDGRTDQAGTSTSLQYMYQKTGKYEASVKVNYKGIAYTAVLPVEVFAPEQAVLAAFTFAANPLTRQVVFSNQSSGQIQGYYWDMDGATDSDNDGDAANDADSTEYAPVHTYSRAAAYRVTLTVAAPNGTYDQVTQVVDLRNLSADQTLNGMPQTDAAKALQARVATVPAINPRDGQVHLREDARRVTFAPVLSRGNITAVRIDANIYADSNGDGNKTNDEDNAGTSSATNTSSSWTADYTPTAARIVAEITVADANGKTDSVKVPIVFDYTAAGVTTPYQSQPTVPAGSGSTAQLPDVPRVQVVREVITITQQAHTAGLEARLAALQQANMLAMADAQELRTRLADISLQRGTTTTQLIKEIQTVQSPLAQTVIREIQQAPGGASAAQLAALQARVDADGTLAAADKQRLLAALADAQKKTSALDAELAKQQAATLQATGAINTANAAAVEQALVKTNETRTQVHTTVLKEIAKLQTQNNSTVDAVRATLAGGAATAQQLQQLRAAVQADATLPAADKTALAATLADAAADMAAAEAVLQTTVAQATVATAAATGDAAAVPSTVGLFIEARGQQKLSYAGLLPDNRAARAALEQYRKKTDGVKTGMAEELNGTIGRLPASSPLRQAYAAAMANPDQDTLASLLAAVEGSDEIDAADRQKLAAKAKSWSEAMAVAEKELNWNVLATLPTGREQAVLAVRALMAGGGNVQDIARVREMVNNATDLTPEERQQLLAAIDDSTKQDIAEYTPAQDITALTDIIKTMPVTERIVPFRAIRALEQAGTDGEMRYNAIRQLEAVFAASTSLTDKQRATAAAALSRLARVEELNDKPAGEDGPSVVDNVEVPTATTPAAEVPDVRPSNTDRALWMTILIVVGQVLGGIVGLFITTMVLLYVAFRVYQARSGDDGMEFDEFVIMAREKIAGLLQRSPAESDDEMEAAAPEKKPEPPAAPAAPAAPAPAPAPTGPVPDWLRLQPTGGGTPAAPEATPAAPATPAPVPVSAPAADNTTAKPVPVSAPAVEASARPVPQRPAPSADGQRTQQPAQGGQQGNTQPVQRPQQNNNSSGAPVPNVPQRPAAQSDAPRQQTAGNVPQRPAPSADGQRTQQPAQGGQQGNTQPVQRPQQNNNSSGAPVPNVPQRPAAPQLPRQEQPTALPRAEQQAQLPQQQKSIDLPRQERHAELPAPEQHLQLAAGPASSEQTTGVSVPSSVPARPVPQRPQRPMADEQRIKQDGGENATMPRQAADAPKQEQPAAAATKTEQTAVSAKATPETTNDTKQPNIDTGSTKAVLDAGAQPVVADDAKRQPADKESAIATEDARRTPDNNTVPQDAVGAAADVQAAEKAEAKQQAATASSADAERVRQPRADVPRRPEGANEMTDANSRRPVGEMINNDKPRSQPAREVIAPQERRPRRATEDGKQEHTGAAIKATTEQGTQDEEKTAPTPTVASQTTTAAADDAQRSADESADNATAKPVPTEAVNTPRQPARPQRDHDHQTSVPPRRVERPAQRPADAAQEQPAALEAAEPMPRPRRTRPLDVRPPQPDEPQ